MLFRTRIGDDGHPLLRIERRTGHAAGVGEKAVDDLYQIERGLHCAAGSGSALRPGARRARR